MEKLADSHGRALVIPKGIDPERFAKVKDQKAVMNATLTPGGSVLVDCPYCIIYWRRKNPVDVTKFVDTDGNRECVTSCNKGHVLRFRPTAQWREERQKMGLQIKP